MVLKDKKNDNSQFLNENIPFSQVLLVTNKEEKAIVSRQEALNQAKSLGLDLLCVSPSTNPPVCKLVNYYQISKNKKKPKENICKEVRISFNIGKNDLKVKMGKIQKWIEEGATVKVNLVMVGKGRIHLAHEKCEKLIEEIKAQVPKIELKDNIRRHLNTFYFFLYKKKQ